MQQFRRIATEQNPTVQLILPMAKIAHLLQDGVGQLVRQAGLQLMHLVMEEEVNRSRASATSSTAGARRITGEPRRILRGGRTEKD